MRYACSAVALALWGCGSEGEPSDSNGSPPSSTTEPTGSTATSPDPTGTTTPTTPTSSTGTTGTVDPCGADPSLSVLSVTPSVGMIETLLQVDITLSAPASVAVQCTSDTTPDEVFFAESTASATAHTVRLSGLVPRTDYSCSVAPTCPTLAGPATPFVHTVGEPPTDLRKLTITEDPALGRGGSWWAAPFTLNVFNGDTWLVVWGPDGTARWWYPAPNGVGMWVEFLWHADLGGFVWGGGMHEEGRIRQIDLWDGEVWAFAPAGWQNEEFHHDGKRLPDGRMLTLEIRNNHQGNLDWDGFGMRVVDPVTNLVDWDFNSQSLVVSGDLPPASGGFDVDPWHANWADYVETPTGPMAYVSLCFGRRILAIDATTGTLAWQFGADLGWTIQDVYGAPLPDSVYPQCQHGIDVAGDVLLVYDNGQDRNQSLAQEWQIDPVTQTATLLWSWSEAGWSEDYIGDIDYLPNGRIFVTEATQQGESELVEVDRATGLVASRAVMTSGYTYRSQLYAGCDLFQSVKECPASKARYDALATLLAP